MTKWTTILAFVGIVVSIGILYGKRQSHQKKKKLEALFAGREPLNDADFYEAYFKVLGVTPEISSKVRKIFEETLNADFSKIKDTDDFSKEFAFFWAMDSMADVEIVIALEKEFGIKITDDEAQEMKTFRDVVLSINRKLNERDVQHL